ncbi:hypothetical protein C5167_006072 [Papaver somniferum]|uniref:Uncharacterized protein n=1 Tax=Papaver somniferum TaxID=3469 RepID=A0A4Y7JCF0_PAPSO|nr:hypothetical protein C5167_006072 [Papaver somniferum]
MMKKQSNVSGDDLPSPPPSIPAVSSDWLSVMNKPLSHSKSFERLDVAADDEVLRGENEKQA